jgi:hypothetical protein
VSLITSFLLLPSQHQISALQSEMDTSSIHSPGYLKLMNKYRYSYQQEALSSSPSNNKNRVYSKSGGGALVPGVIEIMNTRPTPYNFDNENRHQLSVFRLLYDQFNSSVLFQSGDARHSTGSMAYDR